MPFVINHDSQIGALAGLAANVGGYRAGQDAFQNSLHAQANQRAWDQQDFQQQNQQDSGYESALRFIAGLENQRQMQQSGFQNQADLLAQRGVQQQDLQDTRDQNVLDRTSYTQDQINQRSAAGLQTRSDIAGANRDSQQGIADNRNQLGYDQIYSREQQDQANRDAAAQRQADRLQEQQSLEAVKTYQQQLRTNSRLDATAKRQLLQSQVNELAKLRSINEGRAKLGDGEAAGRIGPLNDQIQQTIQQFQQVMQGAPQGAPPAAPQGNYQNALMPVGDESGLGSAASGQQTPAVVQSQADYDALPPGTQYVAPDGTIRVKQ